MAKKYNNADTTLAWDMSASATSFVVKAWEWALFPPTAEAPYKITHEHYEWSVVKKREVLTVSARSGDAFTISARATESCVQDESADPKVRSSNALSFSSWDRVYISMTEEDWNDLQTFKETTVPDTYATKDEVKKSSLVYDASSEWSDAYNITISWLIAYVDWATYRFKADVANDWEATFEINSLWAIALKKNQWQDVLETWDIKAWWIVTATYNSTLSCFQFVWQEATIVIPEVETTSSEVFFWEAFAKWEVWYMSDQSYTSAWMTKEAAFWENSLREKAAFPILLTTWNHTEIDLFLKKTWAPTDNMTIRIETDSAWSPSWTLVSWSASATLDMSTLTTSFVENTISIDYDITTKGMYWLVVWRSWSVDASNYPSIQQRDATMWWKVSKWYNGTTWDETWVESVVNSMWYSRTWNWNFWTQSHSLEVDVNCTITAVQHQVLWTSNPNIRIHGHWIDEQVNWSWSGGQTYNFSWLWVDLVPWNTYTLEINWVSNLDYDNTSFPLWSWNVHLTTWDSNRNFWVISITADETVDIIENKWNYVFYSPEVNINDQFMKTDASDSSKIDALWIARIATSALASWKIDSSWISKTQTWLSIWSKYYLSDTPWAISTTPWTNTQKIWIAWSSTWLLIDKADVVEEKTYDIVTATTSGWSSSYTTTYNHSLWRIPKMFEVDTLHSAWNITSHWYYNDWEYWAIWQEWWARSDCMGIIRYSTWDYFKMTVSNITSTQFDVTYTEVWSCSSTTHYIVMKLS